jgi:outer membrane protein TolC
MGVNVILPRILSFFAQKGKKCVSKAQPGRFIYRRKKMRKLFCAAGLFVLCLGFIFAQEQKTEGIRLTLEKCFEIALEKNLDIAVEAFNPEMSEHSIRKAREPFMPRLTFNYRNWRDNQLSNWFVQGTQYTTKTDTFEIGVRQNIVTGGNFSLSLYNSNRDTTQSFVTFNPTYYGELNFEFNQPLLKNFGPKISRKDIRKARNQRDISVFELKSALVQKIYEVEDAYWNLVSAIESLKVNEASQENSIRHLKMTQEAARIGAKTATDVLDAETEVANWESRIITDRGQVQRAEDTLRNILNLPVDEAGTLPPIVPTDRPTVEKKKITFEEALKTALEERPEMASKQKEIENSRIDMSFARNQLLPELNLRFQLYYPGQSGDRILYLNDDPFSGIVVGSEPGSRGEFWNDIFGLKYDNWRIFFDLTIPLENIFSRASLAEAKVQNDKKLLERERQYKNIYNQLVEAFKDLENKEKALEAAVRYRELREKQLIAGEERYKLGTLPSQWLFEYRSRMATARVSEIRAIINYKLSVAKLEQLMGVNIRTKKLKFRDYDF